MSKTLPTPVAPAQQVTRGVLAIRPFRKLWNSMLFSSLGDWLGLLATTAMAQQLSGGDYAKAKPGDTAPTLTKNVVKKAATKKAAKKAATGKAKKAAK